MLAACGGEGGGTDPIAGVYANYPTDFPITVSSGTAPSFSWTGVQGTSFSVTDYSANTITDDDTWYFFGQGYDGTFGSPVSYGKLPTGADCGILDDPTICPSAKPLIQGHLYEVIIISPDFRVGVKFFKP